MAKKDLSSIADQLFAGDANVDLVDSAPSSSIDTSLIADQLFAGTRDTSSPLVDNSQPIGLDVTIPSSQVTGEGLISTEEPLATNRTLSNAANIELKPAENVEQFLLNIPKSGFKFAAGFLDSISSPVQTAKSVGSLAQGILEKATGSKTVNTKAVDMLADDLVDRYGSLENVKNTFLKDPVGLFADVAPALKTIGVATKSKILKSAGDVTDPTKLGKLAATKTFKTVEDISDSVSKTLDNTAAKLQEAAVGLTTKQIKNISSAKFGKQSISEFFTKHGVKPGSREQLQSRIQDIFDSAKAAKREAIRKSSNLSRRKKLDTELVFDPQSGKSVRINEVNTLSDAILEAKKSQSAKDVIDFKDIKEVKRLKFQHEKVGLTGEEFEKLRNMAEDNGVAGFTGTGASSTKSAAATQQRARSGLVDAIDELTDSNMSELNRDIQMAKALITGLDDAIARNKKPSKLGMIFDLASTGTLTGGLIGLNFPVVAAASGVVVGRQMMKSPTFQLKFANKLKTLSKANLKTLNEAILTGRPIKNSPKILKNVMKAVRSDIAKTVGRDVAQIDIRLDEAIENQSE
jgi:hypothetical protein